MNFSLSTKAFSDPCILMASLRILKGGLARSCPVSYGLCRQ